MILVTGGTGFIGQALIRHLVEMGMPVRTLIRPSRRSPRLPKGIPVEVALTSLFDERGLRAALVGVDTVYHLASGERYGTWTNLRYVDIGGTRAVVQAARDAGVNRFFYLSHLGADRASAYPVLKVKGISEEFIRRSGLDYTILRSAVVFGPNDGLTTGLAQIMQMLPFISLIPGNGEVLLQPLWVEDLATCLTWALDDSDTCKQTYEVGGPEYLRFSQVVDDITQAMGIHRQQYKVPAPYLRGLTRLLESIFPSLPVSTFWLDYLAANRTCAVDTIPRVFHLMPSRFSQRLAYLRGTDWRGVLLRQLLQR